MTFAALDLGTNNCRLLVAEPRSDGFEVVDSFSRIVRLGEGLAATNRLGDAAMSRTIAALQICRRVMRRQGVQHARCVTTEACRRAENAEEFLNRVRLATGITLEVLAEEEEARLAMLGCLPLVDETAAQVLMLDIGGGSSEIMWLDRHGDDHDRPGLAWSMPVGVVTLAESLGGSPDEATYARMVDHVASVVAPYEARHGLLERMRGKHVQMIGTSGTVTTLAALHLGLRRYERRRVDGTTIHIDAIQSVAGALRRQSEAERSANPCIGPGRADLVVAGCAILDAVHRVWPVGEMKVADRGVREGILNQLMGRSLRQAMAGQFAAA